MLTKFGIEPRFGFSFAIVAVAFLCHRECAAGVLGVYGRTDVTLYNQGTFQSFDSASPDSNSTAVTASGWGPYNLSFLEGQSRAEPVASDLLGVTAYVTSLGPRGEVISLAAWRDIVYLSGPSLPQQIRLNLDLSGTVQAGIEIQADHTHQLVQAGLGSKNFVMTADQFAGDFVHQDQSYFWLQNSPNTTIGSTSRVVSSGQYGWDTFQLAATSDPFTWIFSGTAHVILDYNPTLGGYGFTVSTRVKSTVIGYGYANGDFGDTLSLESLTLLDGTSLDQAGFAVSFDSEMVQSSAVPEPSTFSICGLFTVIGLFVGHRSRN